MYSDGKVKVNTIAQQVYSIIKKDIVSGTFKPGYWLQETELAKNLGVSRSPVREALKQLVADGLVVEIPNKGSYVREYTEKEIMEIFEVREMLESYAIRHLNKQFSDEEKATFESYRESFIRLHDEDNLDEYIAVDSKFHRFLIQLAENSILLELYQKVRNMNMMFRILSLSTKKRFDESLDEHISIIDNVLKGNTEEADLINRVHLAYARDTAINQIKKQKTLDSNQIKDVN